MKKEFVVKSIDSAPGGLPYVIVALSSIKDLKDGSKNLQSPFEKSEVMGFSNMNDMMNDLNKMMSGMGGGMGIQSGVTQLKLEMHEYKDMGIAIGDKVFLELSKDESIGV